MLNRNGQSFLKYTVLIAVIFLFNCEKEVSSDSLVKRNGLKYEVNSKKPFSGKSGDYFDDGDVKRESISFKDGLEHGTSKRWYNTGQLEYEAHYKNGKTHGVSKYWFENGQPDMEESHKNDIRNGLTRVWYENGQLQSEISFKDNKIDGVFRKWYENGQPDTEESYKNDQLHGPKKVWHENGQLASKAVYEENQLNGIKQTWFNNGMPKAEMTYKNDQFHGPGKVWYENGQVAMEGKFIENESDGIFREWYENGNLKSEGKFLQDQKVGDWAYWDQNGQVGVVDIDGNIYETVKLGDQVWMAKNLKVTHYRNGDPIPADWPSFSGAFTIYGNDLPNAEIYGNLYNWDAVSDSRNIAPEGWHVPTDAEWQELEMALGMSQSEANDTGFRGTNEGSKLADNTDLWISGSLENDSEFGSSGFTALPGGYRGYDGPYGNMGYGAYFWSATESNSYKAWFRKLSNDSSVVLRNDYGWGNGFSVRLVRD